MSLRSSAAQYYVEMMRDMRAEDCINALVACMRALSNHIEPERRHGSGPIEEGSNDE